MAPRPAHPVLIFDGSCALCDRSVRFMVAHESKPGLVRFAPLQSDAGRDLLRAHGFDPDAMTSVVLIEPGPDGTHPEQPTGDLIGESSRAFVRSAAVLRLARYLRAPWRWVRALGIIPRFILDPLYRLLARHRYAIFGKIEACTLDDRIASRTL